MKLVIDPTKLDLLLEKKRDQIGRSGDGIGDLFAGITFVLSTLCAEYNDMLGLSGETIKVLCGLIGFIFAGRGVVMIVKSLRSKYDHNALLAEIRNLNEVTHPFSIVAVKDTFNAHPNRFLLYYDERWQCKFFFSYRTAETEAANEENIRKRLSGELKVSPDSIRTEYRADRIQRKFSESDRIFKTYSHSVYYAELSAFTDILKQREFIIEGKKFYWMTIAEMERDPQIREKNLDVVDLVKGSIA